MTLFAFAGLTLLCVLVVAEHSTVLKTSADEWS
jgi:hypothetical protein